MARKFEDLRIRPEENGSFVANVPVPVNDYGLFEALAGRWETERWDFIGRYIGSVLLHMTRGTVEGLLKDGIPAIHSALEETILAYEEERRGTKE